MKNFHTKIGNGEHDIPNGDPKITPNGKRLINLANIFNLKILNKSPKCKGKRTRINTKNENQNSIIDYALCTQTLYTNLNTIKIDEENDYKLNGRSKTEHNTIIIKINKSTSTVKKKIDSYQWKINSNTNWTRFRETMQNNIINSQPRNYEELEKIIIQTAVKKLGLFKNKNIEVYTNRKIKARKLKIKAKKEHEMAIRTKNPQQIKNKFDQYKEHQINFTNIIKDYEIKATENKLKVINKSGGTNSKMFCNLKRQIKKSNSEDLYAIKNQNGEKVFNEKDLKQYAELYYKELY